MRSDLVGNRHSGYCKAMAEFVMRFNVNYIGHTFKFLLKGVLSDERNLCGIVGFLSVMIRYSWRRESCHFSRQKTDRKCHLYDIMDNYCHAK